MKTFKISLLILMPVFVILSFYYVIKNVNTKIIIFKDEISTVKSIDILGSEIYSSASNWNLGNDFKINEGVIYYTKLNKETDYITNIVTNSSPIHVIANESNNELDFVTFVSSKEKKITQIRIFTVRASSKKEIYNETFDGHCFINNTYKLQIFCTNSETKAFKVYDLTKNNSNFYTMGLVLSIEGFEQNQPYRILEKYIIIENDDYLGSCIYDRETGQKSCISYPILTDSELIKIFENNKMDSQYVDEFTYQTVSVFDNNYILIFGSAWRFGGGAYWLYNLDDGTSQMLKSEDNSFFHIPNWIHVNNLFKSNVITENSSAYQFSFDLQELFLRKKDLIELDYANTEGNLFISENNVYGVDSNFDLALLESNLCSQKDLLPFIGEYTGLIIIPSHKCDQIKIINTNDSGLKSNLIKISKEDQLNLKDIFY